MSVIPQGFRTGASNSAPIFWPVKLSHEGTRLSNNKNRSRNSTKSWRNELDPLCSQLCCDCCEPISAVINKRSGGSPLDNYSDKWNFSEDIYSHAEIGFIMFLISENHRDDEVNLILNKSQRQIEKKSIIHYCTCTSTHLITFQKLITT